MISLLSLVSLQKHLKLEDERGALGNMWEYNFWLAGRKTTKEIVKDA